MITYDGVTGELDGNAAGIQLLLPLPDARDPRPRVIMHLRFTMTEEVPDRGDFIGQDAMLLVCPAQPVDITHWEELSGFTHEPQKRRRLAMFDQLIIRPEPVAGRDEDMINGTWLYHYTLRHTGGFRFFLELQAAVLPLSAASQQIFGWGENPPSEEELQAMCEELHILEELPLWRILVNVPAGLPDPAGWARRQARERLGLEHLSEHANSLFRTLHFPSGGHVPEVPPVRLLTPWADGEEG